MSLCIVLTNSPFGPLTVTTLSGVTVTVMPAGTAIGNLPTLDISTPPVLFLNSICETISCLFSKFKYYQT
ncbi:Uncharacterised protein [Clostridioides difficile]|nr:Uncharacterised protein [Clostridioides difficile]